MRVLSVVGARPNFVKIAPLYHEMLAHNRHHPAEQFEHLLLHTGQHYDKAMSDTFFEEFDLPKPSYNLNVGSGTHAEQLGNAMIRMEPIMMSLRPDWVVVVGDVNAALAATITAKKINVKVAHIEAGLRSGDLAMPEEINRMLVDRVADLLFATSSQAGQNLANEGVPASKVRVVGNIMIDTLFKYRHDARTVNLEKLLGRQVSSFALVTMHRPSNVDNELTLLQLLSVFDRIAQECTIVFPLHPRTRSALEKFRLLNRLVENPQIIVCEPFSYVQLLALQERASVVLTDSGGLQEECAVLGTPCVTIRTTTERPETLLENGGTNLLSGLDPDNVYRHFNISLGRGKTRTDIPLWDGRTAERIVAAIAAAR